MSTAVRYDETIELPRDARCPVELIPPKGLDPERFEICPKAIGR